MGVCGQTKSDFEACTNNMGYTMLLTKQARFQSNLAQEYASVCVCERERERERERARESESETRVQVLERHVEGIS
jgi:hypothetical protein